MPPGRNRHHEDKQRSQKEHRFRQRDAQHVGQRVDRIRGRERRQPLVEQRVDHAADHCAPAQPDTAEHDDDQNREGEIGRGQPLRRAALQQQVGHADHGGEHPGDDEGQQFDEVGSDADHPHPQFVLPSGDGDVAGAGAFEPGADQEHHDQHGQAQPVQVPGVQHADEHVGHMGRCRSASPSSPPVSLPGVLAHEHSAGLGEGEGHHGEGDSGHPQAECAHHAGQQHPHRQGDADRREKFEAEVFQRDAETVCACREVQRVSERQQAGDAEDEVVAQRQGGNQHAEGEQLEGARGVGGPGKDAGDAQVQHRQQREQRHQGGGQRPADQRPAQDVRHGAAVHPAVPPGAHDLLPRIPRGRTSSTTASNSTTMRSPVPPQ